MEKDNNELKAVLRIYNQIFGEDIEQKLAEYENFLETLLNLHEVLATQKVKMPQWKKYSEYFITKFFLHSNSIKSLLQGLDLSITLGKKNINRRILDLPSTHVLIRAQYETFLMYHHIYVNPKTDEEKEFRFNVWLYTGLLSRQSYPENTDFAKQRKGVERTQLNDLEKKISVSSFFTLLSTKQQKDLFKVGNSRLFKSWNQILFDCGFSKKHMFYTYYKLFSTYAHSEAISILQIKDSPLHHTINNGPANTVILPSKLLICLMIQAINRIHLEVNKEYQTLTRELQQRIRLYSELAKKPID